MKKGNKCLIALMFVSLLTLTGCDPIVPDSPEDGQYATQTPMSAVEYSIYVNKQVTVYTQQLTTRMTMARNAENAGYENELSQTKNSIEIMKDRLGTAIDVYLALNDIIQRHAKMNNVSPTRYLNLCEQVSKMMNLPYDKIDKGEDFTKI